MLLALVLQARNAIGMAFAVRAIRQRFRNWTFGKTILLGLFRKPLGS